jgi:hypothetical protein
MKEGVQNFASGLGEWQQGRTESRLKKLQQAEAFYIGLRAVTESVVLGEVQDYPNTPPSPPEKSFLATQAKSRWDMNDRTGPAPEGAVGKPAYSRLSLDVPPQTWIQRHRATKLAKDMHTIRDARKTQQRRAKVFGDAGLHSAGKTTALRFGLAATDRDAYRSGDIDAFQVLERKRQRKALSVTEAPETVTETAEMLEKLGNETVEKAEKRVGRVQKRISGAEKRLEKLEVKRVSRLPSPPELPIGYGSWYDYTEQRGQNTTPRRRPVEHWDW